MIHEIMAEFLAMFIVVGLTLLVTRWMDDKDKKKTRRINKD
jgi:high-affinity Fe2+/Pb2+ permease